jgi:hypothetical protein
VNNSAPVPSCDTPIVDHDLTPAARAMLAHLHDRFPGCEIAVLPPTLGPIGELVPNLHILSLTPGEGGRIYATAGLWDATHHDGHGLELVLHAPAADNKVHVETLTMVAYYHATGGDYTLGHGHTVPIGRPWVRGSQCDNLLVSLPYPWGPELETCHVPGGHIWVLWLLPITAAEKTFRHTHDLEALEQRFETAGIIPTDPGRKSVVP